jgi:predicted DNA-binding WGR domain protein
MAEKTYLELSEADGSHKFYEVEVDGLNISIRYGRIGTDGTKQSLTFPDPAAALKEAEKKIKEKRKKGYEDAVMGVRKKRTVTRRFVPSSSTATRKGRATKLSELSVPWQFASGTLAFGIYINEKACWMGNEDGRVFKLSHEGNVLAQFKLPDGVKCLVADDAWIYAGCNDGNVYDLTGKVPRVAYRISEDVDIYWLDVNNGWLSVSDAGGHAALFDYEGNPLWQKKGKGSSAWMIRGNFDGKVFYGDSDGVACYNADGSQAWFTETDSVLFGYQDKFALYAGTSSNMVCLSKTGEILQTFDTDGSSVLSCAATEDGQRVFAGDYNDDIYCFDSQGTRLWKLTTGLGSALSMQYFKGHLYIVTSSGYLACVDVSEEAIQKAQQGDVQEAKELDAPKAVAEAKTDVLETAPGDMQGVRLRCVRDGGKLRVKVLSDGYHKDWFVQFPNDLRVEGMYYIADEVKEAAQGGFYRVLGNIFKIEA